MDINLIFFAAIAGLVLIATAITLAVVWRAWQKRTTSAESTSHPVAIGFREGPRGEPVDGVSAPVRSYKRLELEQERGAQDAHWIFEVDIEGELPEGLQLFCTMAAYGPSKPQGGLSFGLDALEETFRIHADTPTAARSYLDEPEVIDALCDLAYDADMTLLQRRRLYVVFFKKPTNKAREQMLDDFVRCWKVLEDRCAAMRAPAVW